jgi:cell division GTPase FtsZ
MIAEAAAGFPFLEASIGGGVFAMAVVFLKYLAKKDEATNVAVTGITKEFSQTVRDVSNNVKIGMDTMHEQTQTLLTDHREREAKHYEQQTKMHDLLRQKGPQ